MNSNYQNTAKEKMLIIVKIVEVIDFRCNYFQTAMVDPCNQSQLRQIVWLTWKTSGNTGLDIEGQKSQDFQDQVQNLYDKISVPQWHLQHNVPNWSESKCSLHRKLPETPLFCPASPWKLIRNRTEQMALFCAGHISEQKPNMDQDRQVNESQIDRILFNSQLY